MFENIVSPEYSLIAFSSLHNFGYVYFEDGANYIYLYNYLVFLIYIGNL